MPSIREATEADCAFVAAGLRQADKQEIEATRGHTRYLEAILDGHKQSSHCFCITDKSNAPVAIYGVVQDPYCPTAGIVWMVASNDLRKINRWFILNSDKVIESVSVAPYEVLWNLIDLRNKTHVRWLQHCDFVFDIVHPGFGPEERPFQRFYKMITPKEEVLPCAI